MDKYFLGQVKQTEGVISKGIVVNDTLDDAKQGYHAYLAAYAYGHDKDKQTGEIKTDYVMVTIEDSKGIQLQAEAWELKAAPVPPEPESE